MQINQFKWRFNESVYIQKGETKMKRRSSKQPTDKKPVVLANSELWREIPDGLQGKVRGGGFIWLDNT